MQIKLQTGRSAFSVTLAGRLAGAFAWPSFERVPPSAREGWAVVDVGGVSEVTPQGAGALLAALPALPAARRVLVNVRPQLLSMIALWPGFVDVAPVGSAWLPLVCGACHKKQEQLLDLRQHAAVVRAYGLPPLPCTSCGHGCALEDDQQVLLAPFAEQAPLDLPDGIDAFWAPPRAVTMTSGMVELDLDGDTCAVWLSGTLQRSAALQRIGAGLGAGVVFVASDVHATTGSGLDALRDLLGSLERPWLARISPVLAQGLATTINGWGNASVASMRLPFACDSCGDTTLIDVDTARRTELAAQRQPPCPRCRCPLRQAFSDRDLMTLHTMPLADTPGAIVAYLRKHPRPPSHDRQAQWTQVLKADASDAPMPATVMTSKPPTQPLGIPESGPTQPTRQTPAKEARNTSRYEVIRRLGVGGMAETLLGRQTGIAGFEKRVVIKRILPALAKKPDFVDMFLHEARVAARISHSNVVQIYDFGHSGDEYYIIMEYVRGYDLATVLRATQRQNKPFPIELAIRVTCDLCAGLSAAHNARDEHGQLDPIIHRDVSPHNVLVSLEGICKLADFGIAKPASMVGVTRPGELKGKIVYMAPEAFRNEPPTVKLDIYAAGLILYTLLAGKNPYVRSSEVQSMYAVAHEGLPPIITLRRDVPFALAATIGRAVNRDPAARFPSAQALQLHLEAFLGEFGRPATAMHLALWVNELMAAETKESPAVDATPSSSLELLEIGSLTTGGSMGSRLHSDGEGAFAPMSEKRES